MILTRNALVLLGSLALSATPAFAQVPGIGIGGGASGGVHAGIGTNPVGAPPVNVPSVNRPPVAAPPVNVPQPQAKAQVDAHAHANVNANAQPAHGTLTAISGTNVTVRLSDGSTRTYSVTSQTAADLRAYVGKPISFTVRDGVLSVPGREAGADVRGTITAVTGSNVTLRLANGTTRVYTVSSQLANELAAYVGKQAVFATESNTLALDTATQLPLVSGTVVAVSGTTASFRLQNGAVRRFAVNAAQAHSLRTQVGRKVEFRIDAQGNLDVQGRH